MKPRIRVVTVPAGVPYVIDFPGRRPRPITCFDKYCYSDDRDNVFRTWVAGEWGSWNGPPGYRRVCTDPITTTSITYIGSDRL